MKWEDVQQQVDKGSSVVIRQWTVTFGFTFKQLHISNLIQIFGTD